MVPVMGRIGLWRFCIAGRLRPEQDHDNLATLLSGANWESIDEVIEAVTESAAPEAASTED
jgi:hypothetical protein